MYHLCSTWTDVPSDGGVLPSFLGASSPRVLVCPPGVGVGVQAAPVDGPQDVDGAVAARRTPQHRRLPDAHHLTPHLLREVGRRWGHEGHG